MTPDASLKSLIWLGSSRKDFIAFPEEVKSEMGYALFQAQAGGRHRKAKTLRGTRLLKSCESFESRESGESFEFLTTLRTLFTLGTLLLL